MVDLQKRFNGKKVALLGIGVSNMPLAEMLYEYGAKLEIRDKKSAEELGNKYEKLKKMGADFVLGENYLEDIKADYVFRSPGFRPDIRQLQKARKNGGSVTSEMEMFIECCPCDIIGVTGSDGKSTTTTIISKILSESGKNVFLGGNIGEPLLNRVPQMEKNDVVAAEISSFQLMTVSHPVTVGVIKNVTPNHLNWHTGMGEYIEAKAKIINGVKRAVLNYDDEVCRKLGETCQSPVVWFSRGEIPKSFLKKYEGGVYEKNGKIIYYSSEKDTETEILDRAKILLPGDHNAENYSTAIAATLGYATKEAIQKVAENFGGVPHRLELVRIKDGVKYYNSSIDSSPTRTAAAISALRCPIRIICGGYDKNIPFEPLAEALVSNKNIKTVVLTGHTAKKIETALKNNPDFNNSGIEMLFENDFTKAVQSAAESAKDGDAVLLSPACASFDAFENFEKRGEKFREIVKLL